MEIKIRTMDEQLDEEKLPTHLGILNKFFERRKDIEVLDIRDVHGGHLSNRDIEVDVIIRGKHQTLVVEGKRDTFKKEDTHDEEHMAIEIFAYCIDGVFDFRNRYAMRRRIDKDDNVYSILIGHIDDVIKGVEDGTYMSGVKYGYGWTKKLTNDESELPVFSYYWQLWKKAGLYRGNKLKDLAMKLYAEKNKHCKFVLTPNDDYVTVNFLIPSHILREEGCLISLIDFDEETELP